MAERSKKDEEYEAEEVVLGFLGPLLYDAKVSKVDKTGEKSKHKYFLHYQGWSKKWDEWVTTERMLKRTPENIKYQDELKEKVKQDKQSGVKRKATDDLKSGKKGKGDAKGNKKRKLNDEDETVEPDAERVEKKEIKLKLPGALKKVLIHDWECVTRNQKLVELPRAETVNKLLEEYRTSKKAKGPANETANQEVVDGLRQYFDRSLSKMLLYKFERAQFAELMEKPEFKEKLPADIYGPEHLLRLFVKLPTLLAHTQLSHKEASTLTTKLAEFLKWFQKKGEKMFAAEHYVKADKAYVQRVEQKHQQHPTGSAAAAAAAAAEPVPV